MEQTYKRIILRHYQNPSNKIDIKKPTEIFPGSNPSCGDVIEIKVKLGNTGKIIDVSWSGDGCVISQASASIFTDLIIGQTLTAVKKITSEEFLKHVNIDLSPSRRKCALLPLFTIKDITDEE